MHLKQIDILLVDGYNMIGAWPELRKLKERDLSESRDRLIEKMAEYQAYSGFRVIVVFDAHFVRGVGRKYKNYKIDVIFTRENNTADELIEKLVCELNRKKTQIYVATSDYTEQSVTFGQGALRKSARELLNEINHIETEIDKEVKEIINKKNSAKIKLTNEVAEIFEKWRRGER
jgi:uncharacterized protein